MKSGLRGPPHVRRCLELVVPIHRMTRQALHPQQLPKRVRRLSQAEKPDAESVVLRFQLVHLQLNCLKGGPSAVVRLGCHFVGFDCHTNKVRPLRTNLSRAFANVRSERMSGSTARRASYYWVCISQVERCCSRNRSSAPESALLRSY